MTASSRGRALALILVTFLVGGVAGAAVDRLWVRRVQSTMVVYAPREGPGGTNRRSGIEPDRIPLPLEALRLTPEETTRLHEIARRWRPAGARVTDSMRTVVSGLENDMFAEMLCAISKDKQDRYLAQLQQNGAPPAMIDTRFRLVRSNQCDATRR